MNNIIRAFVSVNRFYKLQGCDIYDKQQVILPGDLVEYVRGPFSHWGVYLGYNQIAHLPGPSNFFANFHIFQVIWRGLSGHWIERMQIEICNLNDLLSSSIAYINNSKDSMFQPLPRNEIVQRAYNALGDTSYDLLFHNCEHFAHWCRYGIVMSDQVSCFVLLISTIGLFACLSPWTKFISKYQIFIASGVVLSTILFSLIV